MNGKYRFICDRCGVESATDAKHRLRQNPLECLACIRIRNNWNCRQCGTTDPYHPHGCNA